MLDLKRKVRLSTVLGTYQATLTNFGYLSKEWKENCEEEALLGVSITGYYDNSTIRKDEVLNNLREESIRVNREYAKKFGINVAFEGGEAETFVLNAPMFKRRLEIKDAQTIMHDKYSGIYLIKKIKLTKN